MDARVAQLTTPEECEQLAKNVEKRLPDLAQEARRRAVELRAAKHGAQTIAEKEALEAVYAYERTLWQKHGRKIRASRTWQMIERVGIIPAVQRIVEREDESAGYTALEAMGMKDMAFEAVVLRHPHLFSARAVARSRERLPDYSEPDEI